MNKVLPNPLNIKLKIMSYNQKDDELDIKLVPIIGWSVQESYVDPKDLDWEIFPVDAKPIVPCNISITDKLFYEWNDHTYNLYWESIEYENIKDELKSGKS